MKSQIIERLGQTEVLLPALIGEGLAANDKVKARLSILQAAGRHARDAQARFDLEDECNAAGLDADAMATLVNGAAAAGERLAAPGLDALIAAIWDDVATMARAVKAGDGDTGDAALARLDALKRAVGADAPDTLKLAQIAQADRDLRWRGRQPAPAHHGSAQGAEPAVRRPRRRGDRRRPCLRPHQGGPSGDRSLHARRRIDAPAQVRSPRPCHHRFAHAARGSPSRTTSARPTRMSLSSPSRPMR